MGHLASTPADAVLTLGDLFILVLSIDAYNAEQKRQQQQHG